MATDVDCSFDTTYVRFFDPETQKVVIRSIENSLTTRICIEESNLVEGEF
jgi:hypothetical protein